MLLAIQQHDFALPGRGPEERPLEAAIRQAVENDPAARPASVAEFAAELLPPLPAWPVDPTSATSGTGAAPV